MHYIPWLPIAWLQITCRMTLLFLAFALTAACSQPVSVAPQQPQQPTPTVSSLFEDIATPLPSAQLIVVPTAQPTKESEPQPTTLVTTTSKLDELFDARLDREFIRVPIYNDALAADWTLKNSYMTSYNIKSSAQVDQGQRSIEVVPKVATTVLLFALQKSSTLSFERKRVAGVHFRLNGGDNYIANDAMTVSILGSNERPYWIENDTSVVVNHPVTLENPIFSETRLYYLGFDRAIPSNTWVDVTDWLSELQYDPDYKYVTGFSIKVDQALLPRYYLDQVELLLWPE